MKKFFLFIIACCCILTSKSATLLSNNYFSAISGLYAFNYGNISNGFDIEILTEQAERVLFSEWEIVYSDRNVHFEDTPYTEDALFLASPGSFKILIFDDFNPSTLYEATVRFEVTLHGENGSGRRALLQVYCNYTPGDAPTEANHYYDWPARLNIEFTILSQ